MNPRRRSFPHNFSREKVPREISFNSFPGDTCRQTKTNNRILVPGSRIRRSERYQGSSVDRGGPRKRAQRGANDSESAHIARQPVSLSLLHIFRVPWPRYTTSSSQRRIGGPFNFGDIERSVDKERQNRRRLKWTRFAVLTCLSFDSTQRAEGNYWGTFLDRIDQAR